MKQIQEITRPATLAQFTAAPGLPAFDANDLQSHAVDAHFMVSDGATLLARCSLWWQNTPQYREQRTGIIGHFAACDQSSAAQLLEHACAQLGARGCTYAIGPMNGSTWRSYRLVTKSTGEPPFFLEPKNPDNWPLHWQTAGFSTIAEYSSQLNTDLNYQDPRLARVEQRLQQHNITIQPLNLDDYDAELHDIFDLSCRSFRPNFLYTPIEAATFSAMYRPLRPYIRPELVLLARRDNTTVGFLFALPDWHQAQRGHAIDTVIIKTLAVLPGRIYAGLGNLLAANCHRAARELGYTRAIHALMHDANHSRNLSSHYAHVIRRYALYGKTL